MKLNKIKKAKKEFDPITHWYSLLAVMSVLMVLVICYSIYSFLYIKNQIILIRMEAENNAQSGDLIQKSRQNKDIMKGITALNSKLEEFAKKEDAYNALLKMPVTAASTSVATSTN